MAQNSRQRSKQGSNTFRFFKWDTFMFSQITYASNLNVNQLTLWEGGWGYVHFMATIKEILKNENKMDYLI